MHYKPLSISKEFNKQLEIGWSRKQRQERTLREKLKALQSEHRTQIKN